MISTFRDNGRSIRTDDVAFTIGQQCDSSIIAPRRDYSRCEYFGDYSQTLLRHCGLGTCVIYGWPITVIRLPLSPSGSLEMSGGPPKPAILPFRFHSSPSLLDPQVSAFGFTRILVCKSQACTIYLRGTNCISMHFFIFLECRN